MMLSKGLRGLCTWAASLVDGQPRERGMVVLDATDYHDLLAMLEGYVVKIAELEQLQIPPHLRVRDNPLPEGVVDIETARQKRINCYPERSKPL